MTITDNSEEILRIFRSNDPLSIQRFIAQCPDIPMKETAILMAGINTPEASITALDLLASGYVYGANCELGLFLSKICFLLSTEAYEQHGPGTANTYILTAGRSAVSYLKALQELGRNRELICFANEAITWLSQVHDTENIRLLYLYRIQAHLELQHYDLAQRLYDEIKNFNFNGAERIHLQFIEDTLEFIKQDPTRLPDRKSVEEKITSKRREIFANMIEIFHDMEPSAAGILNTLQQQLNQTVEKNESAALFQGISESADRIKDFLTRGKASVARESNEAEIAGRLRRATGIFLDPNIGRKPHLINNSLINLREIQALAADRFPQHENDALWGIYLCHSRLGQVPEAVTALQKLRRNIEKARAGIANPFERAGLLTKYPYLFHSLTQKLCELNHPLELLEAIEGAKGRVLADVLTEREGRAIPDQDFSVIASEITSLMLRVNAHYLSYFLDDDQTYAVLVAKDGSAYAHTIPIGRNTLSSWYPEIIPARWELKDPVTLKRYPGDLPERLAPLVDWLTPLAESGLIAKDDHLCYSPDDLLHLIPLQYVTFRGEPLIKYVSLSRIHGAKALLTILERDNYRPARFTTVQVPAQQDLHNSELLKTFEQAADWFRGQKMNGDILSGTGADIKALSNHELTHRIIHFATHGFFPERDNPDSSVNPYRNSGLLLASNGHLPDKSNIDNLRQDAPDRLASLFTPEQVLKMKLDFRASHLTLQACITGLAREGLGGDALGLEWAFLLAGASSLIVTLWNVNAYIAVDFSIGFYRRWLVQKESRALAWRKTVLELMKRDFNAVSQEKHHPTYFWAPFCLTGDWR